MCRVIAVPRENMKTNECAVTAMGLLVTHACLLVAMLVTLATADTMDFIPDSGGWPMADVFVGKSATLDYRGQHYYFFALDPAIDTYVSGDMLNKGGWEVGLNMLFDALVQEEPHHKKLSVLDVGANMGAFSLHAAARGCSVFSFEMQPRIYGLLELSRRLNGFHNMVLHHAALWNETGSAVSFTPARGNFGGTTLLSGGAAGTHEMKTKRIDELFTHKEVFFMKIDVENNEDRVLHGMESLLATRSVKHFVMETRPNQDYMVDWFYGMGYACGTYDRQLLDIEGAKRLVQHKDLGDIYCTVLNKREGSTIRRLLEQVKT